MTTQGRRTCSSAAGFTLIEMLVVLSILALVAAFGMPLLSRGSESVRLETAASELSGALRVTRAAAVSGNRQISLMIDIERRTFESIVVPRRSFASDIDAKLTYASAIRAGSSEAGFQFFPDGSSTGGEIALSLHGKQAKLCIDWLTGSVRKDLECGTS